MSKIFLANTSGQNHIFNLRIPGTGKVYTSKVNAGGQVMVIDGDKDIIDAAIAHFDTYKIPNIKEVDRTKHYFGQVYSVDKEISSELIERHFYEGGEKLDDAAGLSRKNTAAASKKAMEDAGLDAESLEVENVKINEKGKTEGSEKITVKSSK